MAQIGPPPGVVSPVPASAALMKLEVSYFTFAALGSFAGRRI